ncbi:MAG: plasmid replication protein, CyRepA1 family [Cyanobacteriota bacterium]|nr:plasmid replication protein, CyRepA1 family [Cyanobacteriota bacterium]
MNYLQEWQASAVDEDLIRLNVVSLNGAEASDYLLYSETLPRRNDGRVSRTILERYEHLSAGGWWCAGIDLLSGEENAWGCFKPQFPRLSVEKGRPIKYEHPPQVQTGIFALRVPDRLWQRIADRAAVPLAPEDQDSEQPDGGFWQWVMTHPQVPLCITEGAKKAGALLTAGYSAIALPGVHNGCRTPRDEGGQRIGKSALLPELQKLAAPGRRVYFVFDQDQKPETIKSVNLAIQRLGYLLQREGCECRVIAWDLSLGKGVDDLIALQGSQYFDRVYQEALPLELWRAQGLNELTYPAALTLDAPFLPALEIPPQARLAALYSPKGTGKTEALATLVKAARAQGRPVLVIGHRIKLVQELCRRFGLPYLSDIADPRLGAASGYGLCIDSLHLQSQAQFRPQEWREALIVIDEVEQVLWHALNADTCRGQRVAVLRTLKTLLQTALSAGGQLLVADADLSDLSLDYLTALAGFPLQPHLVRNTWKPAPEQAWPVYHYGENDPKQLIADLVAHIQEGGRPFVCLSAQKLTSAWGTQNLETYLAQTFPQRRILRLDAESLADLHHPARQALSNLNEVLKNYDIVLASPAIETGISLDLRGHFTSVWGLAQGVQTAPSVCQALARLRENVPRYLWIANYGFNQVGNGATSIQKLLSSGQRLTELNIRLLQQADLEALEDVDCGFQAESLLAWAKMAVRVNAAMLRYREAVLSLLQRSGHRLLGAPSFESGETEEALNPAELSLGEVIQAVKIQNYQAECLAIASAPSLSLKSYQSLKKSLVKTTQERRLLRKYELEQRYGITITPQIVERDDQGWYRKLRLHYFLTSGRPYLADRDAKIARTLLDQGQGSLFLPDFNGSQLGVIIGTLDVLGLPILLAQPQRPLSALDEDLIRLGEVARRNRADLKTVTGVGVAKNASPITILRRFLDLIGHGLKPVRSQRIGGKSVRIYQLILPQDGREWVFQVWLERDRNQPGSSEGWLEDYWLKLQTPLGTETLAVPPHQQLSLPFSPPPER